MVDYVEGCREVEENQDRGEGGCLRSLQGFFDSFPVEVRNPLCFQRVPKSWTTPKAYLLSVKIYTV